MSGGEISANVVKSNNLGLYEDVYLHSRRFANYAIEKSVGVGKIKM
jgi:hypothetical protein